MTRGSVSRPRSRAGSRPPSAGNARETHFFAASSESFSGAAFCLPLVTQLRRLDCPMLARRRRDDVLEEFVAARVCERSREWTPRSACAAWCLNYRARRRRASTDRPSGSAFHSRDSKTRSKTPLHARGVQRSDNTIPFMLLFFFRGKKNWTGRGGGRPTWQGASRHPGASSDTPTSDASNRPGLPRRGSRPVPRSGRRFSRARKFLVFDF